MFDSELNEDPTKYEDPDKSDELTKEQKTTVSGHYNPISWHFGHSITISRFTDGSTGLISDYQIECLDCENETLAVQQIRLTFPTICLCINCDNDTHDTRGYCEDCLEHNCQQD